MGYKEDFKRRELEHELYFEDLDERRRQKEEKAERERKRLEELRKKLGVSGSYRHGKCAAYQCNHPLDPPEWDCGYNTTIECEECKYCIGAGGRKDPEAKCNQQK